MQDLADRAIDKWKQWNKDSGQELFSNSGWARLTDIGRPQDVDLETYETMKKAGLGQTQYSLHSEEDLKRAEGDGRGLPLDGVFDSNADLANVDLACKYALYAAEKGGAEAYFRDGRGGFRSFIRDDKDPRRVIGIVAKNQQRHFADAWSLSRRGMHSALIVPELPRPRGGPPLAPIQETKDFIRENLPELVGAEMAAVKMCWYADAPDLEFVVDRIPGADLVVTGGSFHGKAQILAGPG
ncbi:hypothetical protein ACJ41O_011193 [Fusarium nematophilum]